MQPLRCAATHLKTGHRFLQHASNTQCSAKHSTRAAAHAPAHSSCDPALHAPSPTQPSPATRRSCAPFSEFLYYCDSDKMMTNNRVGCLNNLTTRSRTTLQLQNSNSGLSSVSTVSTKPTAAAPKQAAFRSHPSKTFKCAARAQIRRSYSRVPHRYFVPGPQHASQLHRGAQRPPPTCSCSSL